MRRKPKREIEKAVEKRSASYLEAVTFFMAKGKPLSISSETGVLLSFVGFNR